MERSHQLNCSDSTLIMASGQYFYVVTVLNTLVFNPLKTWITHFLTLSATLRTHETLECG
jgi:hypothetical protein